MTRKITSEHEVIKRTGTPFTVDSLAAELCACGLQEGQTVLVHMAMSKLGWVIGGPEAVILAFLDVLGESGTLMMPSHSTNNSDPHDWQNPPIPSDWWQLVRDHTPAYNPYTTPTRMMGAAAELFRTWPGTIRSPHPALSFAARGPKAAYLVGNHPVEADVGEGSPIARLYELDGQVMLLGVGHGNNTSLHLAEFRADFPGKSRSRSGCAMLVEGERRWVEYETLYLHDDDFDEIGLAFEVANQIEVQRIAQADVRLFKQRELVDFGVEWMGQNRDFRG